MNDSRFRGWIYWACFLFFCLLYYLATFIFENAIVTIISFFASVLVFGIFARIEMDNLLSNLNWYHRDTMDAINSDWYHRDWRMVDFVFSDKLDDDPEMKLHKRNNRHVTIAASATMVAFIVSIALIVFSSGAQMHH